MSVLCGVILLVWPRAALVGVTVLIGVWLFVVGVVRLGEALLSRDRTRLDQWLAALVGVACMAAGVLCWRNPRVSLALLALLVGLKWLASAALHLIDGLRHDGPERSSLIAMGVGTGVAGLAFVVWPQLSLGAFVLLTGVGAVIIGVLQITAAVRLRRCQYRDGGSATASADVGVVVPRSS